MARRFEIEDTIRGDLFVVRETRLGLEMPITLGAGDSDGGESARRPSHTIATRLVADVCGITRARCYTLYTNLFAIAPVIFTIT